jgi:hypothetical protein
MPLIIGVPGEYECTFKVKVSMLKDTQSEIKELIVGLKN